DFVCHSAALRNDKQTIGNDDGKSSGLWCELYPSHPSLMKPRWMGHPANGFNSETALRSAWIIFRDGVMVRTTNKMRGFFPGTSCSVRMTISFCITVTVRWL
ncbi:MAG: hypothetical protein P4K80_08935, partial [Acidobacteriaceae bacterium]|nr:hypothetical protein [Acidobacteriaceae bacterium]